MNRTNLRRLPILTCMLLLWASGAIAAQFDEIVIFGDSLSDNGNFILIEDQPFPDPTEYWEGRFSNGPVWAEYLSDPERLNGSLDDRAYGGAESDGALPPGLIEQVIIYITAARPPLSAKALFAIWIGGNDCLNESRDAEEVVANVKDAMERLVKHDARHILVLNLPDLGTIPARAGTSKAAAATAFSTDFNQGLADMLDQFSLDHPEVGLYDVDIFSFFKTLRGDPAAYGFTNATEPSPNFDVPDNFDGAGYVFWDDIHPTTEVHALIADQVYDDLEQQVPETEVDDEDGSAAEGSCFIGALNSFGP